MPFIRLCRSNNIKLQEEITRWQMKRFKDILEMYWEKLQISKWVLRIHDHLDGEETLGGTVTLYWCISSTKKPGVDHGRNVPPPNPPTYTLLPPPTHFHSNIGTLQCLRIQRNAMGIYHYLLKGSHSERRNCSGQANRLHNSF